MNSKNVMRKRKSVENILSITKKILVVNSPFMENLKFSLYRFITYYYITLLGQKNMLLQ